MFGKLGAPEILLILVVLIMLFGAKRLPGMARSLGQSLRILKSETDAMRDRDAEEDATTTAASTPEIVESKPLAASTAATHKIVSSSH
ncbi:Sec-independent protein translocase subunit TatA [Streptomyces siamensis]|uniref:Sec-independent protein translocase protein TatA n=1 Tax=Streptomyces siamensis TaxID=1274986 RepID=A0ABP9J478_9ACTN